MSATWSNEFSGRRTFVTLAEETCAIRMSSTVGFGAHREGETWPLGEGVDRVATRVEDRGGELRAH